MKFDLRNYIKERVGNHTLSYLSIIYNNLPFNNRFRIKGRQNKIITKGNFCRNCLFEIIGSDNKIIFNETSKNYMKDCKFRIYGNGNTIRLGRRNSFVGVEIWIEDDKNSFQAGNNNVLLNNMHIAITECHSVIFGDDNVVSSYCTIRTGDSHSIISLTSEQRINKAKSVVLHDRIWVGNNVTILKGTEINDDTVVATGSIVTKPFYKSNIIIGGNPAKIIKEGIKWCKKRI